MSATTAADLILTSPDGVWVDTRAFSGLADLVNSRGDTETFVLLAREEVVSTQLTLPQSWHLLFARGGRIRVAAGGDLSVSAASVNAPAGRQIFEIDQGGILRLTTEGRKARLSWFSSMSAALAAIPSGGTLVVDRDETLSGTLDASSVALEWEAAGPTLTLSAGAQLWLNRVIAGEWPIFSGVTPAGLKPRAGSRLKAEWFQDLGQFSTVIDPQVACTAAFSSVVPNNVDGLVVPANLTLYFEAGAGIDQATGTTLTIAGGVFSLSNWRFGDGLITVNGDEMAVGSYIRVTDDLNQYITQIEPGKIRIGPATQFDPGYDPNQAYTLAQTAQVDATQAIADAAAAHAAADGKIVSYYQSTPPTGQSIGDIWFDTDDNNRAYYWNGTSWVDASDYRIVQALNSAFTAQATADGKATLYYADSGLPPASPEDGDLWFRTDTGRLAVYDAVVGGWVDHVVGSVTYHQAAPPVGAVDGDIWYDTDDGIFFVYDGATGVWLAQFIGYSSYVQGTPPSNPRVGDVWYDTVSTSFKRWDGSAWVVEHTHTLNHIGNTAPANPKDGDIWYNTNDGVFYVYDAATPQWRPQFKGNRTFYGPTPPADPQVGDVWYDTNVGQFKRWDGSAWIQTKAGNYTYRDTTPPPNPEVGDVWMNPNDGKVQWWDGSAWLPYGDDTETVIKNGLVTTGTLIVRDGANNEQAGITGTEDTNPADTDVRIWAGASYANRDNAKFRVFKDGTVVANSVIVESGYEGFVVQGTDGAITRLSDGRISYTDPNGNTTSIQTKIGIGRCTHNTPVTFDMPFEGTPYIIMSPDGMTWPPSTANPVVLDCHATNITSAGFTPVVRLREGSWSLESSPNVTLASLTITPSDPYGTASSGSHVFTIANTAGVRAYIYLDLADYVSFQIFGSYAYLWFRAKANLTLSSSPAGANTWTTRATAEYYDHEGVEVVMEAAGLPIDTYDFKIDCTITYYYGELSSGSWSVNFTTKLSRYDKLSSFTEVVTGDAYYLAIGR
ncbi:MAG: hypothetical protein KatS3mg015_2768 [Fimbriimonadales bacterium]|nr:MAG: hypothetical protein KatS3mg015_2768 [Fimbriimonadales bacterium]